MTKRIRRQIVCVMVIIAPMSCFYAGCSSPPQRFYDAIGNQDVKSISKYYERINASEQDECMKAGLSNACAGGNKMVVGELLKLGAQPKECAYLEKSIDKDNDLDFITYVYGMNQRSIECLNSSLKKALVNERIDAMRYFIEMGADVNTSTDKGETSLHHAITKKDFSLVNILLQRNANVNMANNEGKTALHQAILNGDMPLVNLLLQNGADVNMANNEGKTALHQAILNGDMPLVNLLLQNGADINVQQRAYKLKMVVPNGNVYAAVFNIDSAGEYSLSLAINKYLNDTDGHNDVYLAIIELLLKRNADANLLVVENRWLSIYDNYTESKEISRSFKKEGGKLTIFHLFADNSYCGMFRGNNSAKGECGNKSTGAYFRFERDGNEILTITTNSVPLEKYYSERTVSQIVAEKGRKELLALLEKYGADFSIKDSNNKNP